jgi:hypothetical protein
VDREARKREKKLTVASTTGEDPGIAGIVPGPKNKYYRFVMNCNFFLLAANSDELTIAVPLRIRCGM